MALEMVNISAFEKSGCKETVVKNGLNRKIAIILGLLFILAIVAGLLLDTSDNSADISINQNQGVMGTPFEFTLAIVVVVMPILMYPILKKYKLSMAIGFVGGPLAIRNWGYGMVAPIVFSIDSLIFYYLLYKSKTHSSMVIRLGSYWSHIVFSISLFTSVKLCFAFKPRLFASYRCRESNGFSSMAHS